MRPVKVALCQLDIAEEKAVNLSRAAELVGQAARAQADFAILPEMFVCPFANCNFRPNAEEAGGATVQFLSNLAKYHGLYLVAGSIPELNGGKVYNTSYFFDRNGQVLGKHQKMHLFDAVFQDGSVYRESDAIQAGDHITVVQTEFGPVGLAICFDIRFSELFRLMSLQNVGMIFHPAAFNLSTGPAHCPRPQHHFPEPADGIGPPSPRKTGEDTAGPAPAATPEQSAPDATAPSQSSEIRLPAGRIAPPPENGYDA